MINKYNMATQDKMPLGDFQSTQGGEYTLKGYNTDMGGSEVYVKPGTYVPGISLTPYTAPTTGGSSTPTAPATPTTPTTPTTTTTYNRLPPGVTQEAYDAANKAKYETKTPEQAAQEYRDSQMKIMQGRIDEINKTYAAKLQSELAAQAPINENAMGRTNALSALMGLGGSATAGTRTAVTEKSNAAINAGITAKVNAEKQAALGEIYGRIDEGAQKMAEAQLATNKANQKALLDDVAKNALSSLQSMAGTLADTGKTFDDFKAADPDTLKAIMDQTGKSEYQLRAEWNNSIPEDLRPTKHTSYRDDGKGGTIMSIVEFNPITKKATSTDYPINAPISTFQGEVKPIEGKNGELFVPDGQGGYKDVSPNAANTKALLEAKLANERRLARGGNGSGTDESKEIAKFQEAAAAMIPKLDAGEISWGAAFDSLKAQYPQATNETINNILGGSIPYDASTRKFDYSKATGRAIAK